ncbi:unnamed protein product [Cyclocybe aegerita]|uniref:Uncharacterized protein n=1 Tax=Cyclocybe aegerita TaxID=1973307 RepID=A0A8S0XXD0_CYCAE|nr:unnamed protein product [Cyclocybe aegerita]
MELYFRIPGGPSDIRYTFRKPIPAALCRPDAPRELATPFVSKVINGCEKEILAKRNWSCRCGKLATFFHGIPMVTLVDYPPTEILKWVQSSTAETLKEFPGTSVDTAR